MYGKDDNKLPIAILISGSGSNLQAIIDAAKNGLPVDIRLVISNRADAYGLERARQAGIRTAVVHHQDYKSRTGFDAQLAGLITESGAELVVLAGFMRILSDEFVHRFEGRLMNIHPSLLPKYRGLDTHARAISAGEESHGASVHFVVCELDAGPVIIQARVPVLPDDTPDRLAARVLEQEHIIYPRAIRWFAEGRLQLHAGQAILDGRPISPST